MLKSRLANTLAARIKGARSALEDGAGYDPAILASAIAEAETLLSQWDGGVGSDSQWENAESLAHWDGDDRSFNRLLAQANAAAEARAALVVAFGHDPLDVAGKAARAEAAREAVARARRFLGAIEDAATAAAQFARQSRQWAECPLYAMLADGTVLREVVRGYTDGCRGETWYATTYRGVHAAPTKASIKSGHIGVPATAEQLAEAEEIRYTADCLTELLAAIAADPDHNQWCPQMVHTQWSHAHKVFPACDWLPGIRAEDAKGNTGLSGVDAFSREYVANAQWPRMEQEREEAPRIAALIKKARAEADRLRGTDDWNAENLDRLIAAVESNPHARGSKRAPTALERLRDAIAELTPVAAAQMVATHNPFAALRGMMTQ